MRKAFSLIELLIAVALAGAMAIFTFSIIDTATISKDAVKAELQSHLNLITAAVHQCKEISSSMPIQSDGLLASGTTLNTLDCNASTPYQLDGGRGTFIPSPVNGFTAYTATENGSEFYITTTTNINSRYDDVLKDLNTTYSANQYVLTHDATTAYLNFYISR